jgi:hypothetical protein
MSTIDAHEAPKLLTPEEFRRKIAIHEAGHAIAFIRNNVNLGFVTIVPSKNADGETLGGGDAWNKREGQKHLIIHCAGYAACISAGYTEDQAASGCGQDFVYAQIEIDRWRLGTLTDAKAMAVKFMRRRKNVRAVDLLAQHLLQHDRLDAHYVQVLVTVADGETTEAEFDEYLELRLFEEEESARRRASK